MRGGARGDSPGGPSVRLARRLAARLSPDQFKLYDLIWKRTVASQMADARCRRITIAVAADGALFQASGRIIDFPGYLRAYVEGSDDPDARLADREVALPDVAVGESLLCRGIEPKSHATQPPNRYSEASLTRALEEMGIGRPSTYAQIIDTILARDYVFKIGRGNVLVPTWTAFAVSQLLERHLPSLVNYQFTAEMEDELDAISRGELSSLEYLNRFYFGNDHPGLKEQLKNKSTRSTPAKSAASSSASRRARRRCTFASGVTGRFSSKAIAAQIPDKMPPDEMTLAAAVEMLDKAGQNEQPLGVCPQTQKPIFLKVGRFGPYVQRGVAEDDEKPQNASLLKGMQPEDVTLDVALRLLSLPRAWAAPGNGQPVAAHNGPYGPYVKCGDETRSLGGGLSPLDVTLEQALELLAQPKSVSRPRRAKSR